jgi:NAD(P)-dependent dehydrogenase (short-subunit alcohol dehydrogenase family)
VKKILVIGTGSSIAKSFCSKFKNEYEFLGTSRDGKALPDFAGNFKLDFLKPDYDFISALPVVDGVLVASGITSHVPVKYIKPAQIEDTFNVNFFGILKLITGLIKEKKLANGSSLVFLGSVAAKYPYPGGVLYTASKRALEGLSATLAVELASKKIRSNVVAPVLVESDMADSILQFSDEEALQRFSSQHPFGVITTEQVSGLIHFLLNDSSSGITGQIMQAGNFNTSLNA